MLKNVGKWIIFIDFRMYIWKIRWVLDIRLGWLAVYMNLDSQRILKYFMFIKSGKYKC